MGRLGRTLRRLSVIALAVCSFAAAASAPETAHSAEAESSRLTDERLTDFVERGTRYWQYTIGQTPCTPTFRWVKWSLSPGGVAWAFPDTCVIVLLDGPDGSVLNLPADVQCDLIAHELGHMLGLDHDLDWKYPVMHWQMGLSSKVPQCSREYEQKVTVDQRYFQRWDLADDLEFGGMAERKRRFRDRRWAKRRKGGYVERITVRAK